MPIRRLIPLVLATSASPLLAQDGGQLYGLYCAACHGDDGRGATEGTFPPLAGSPWVNDAPELPIKIILHGLTGPVDVLGKSYDLEMAPQGAALTDSQIAAILTYVRSSWGNTGSVVSEELVRTVRSAEAGRDKPWTQAEILKLHPLKLSQTNLENLVSRVYFGQWQDLPDFDKLQPESIEEEHAGIISVSQSPRKDHFGLLWEGDFMAPADGEYTFRLDADDAARVILNGNMVAEVRGTGAMNGSRAREGKITLKQGANPIRIEYIEYLGQEGITLGWKGPGIDRWRWLSDQAGGNSREWPNIPIQPGAGRTAVYRNFIAGTTARAIGFGFPGGINIAYSADHHAPELIWSGDFMNGGRHWTNRGIGAEPPAGGNITNLGKSPALPPGARFGGYQLDAQGNPTFIVRLAGQTLRDSWKPATGPALERRLEIDGADPLEILISDQLPPIGGANRYLFDGNLAIEGAPLELRDGKAFLLLHPGQPVTLSYRLNP
jgi:mono/diheme cytochrome c family protein